MKISNGRTLKSARDNFKHRSCTHDYHHIIRSLLLLCDARQQQEEQPAHDI